MRIQIGFSACTWPELATFIHSKKHPEALKNNLDQERNTLSETKYRSTALSGSADTRWSWWEQGARGLILKPRQLRRHKSEPSFWQQRRVRLSSLQSHRWDFSAQPELLHQRPLQNEKCLIWKWTLICYQEFILNPSILAAGEKRTNWKAFLQISESSSTFALQMRVSPAK